MCSFPSSILPVMGHVFLSMCVQNIFCVIMAGTTANKCKVCMVKPFRSDETRRVGVFARWKENGFPLPQILKRIGEFNETHNSSLRLIRPETAELVVNPASMFPNLEPTMALSILRDSGRITSYPFEEGLFPTSTLIVYPAPGEHLPANGEVVSRGRGNSALILEIGEHAGANYAVLFTGITEKSTILDGGMSRIVPGGLEFFRFLNFPNADFDFVPRHNADPSTKEAFVASGGIMHARSGKMFLRRKEEFAAFIVRNGKPKGDPASQKDICEYLAFQQVQAGPCGNSR